MFSFHDVTKEKSIIYESFESIKKASKGKGLFGNKQSFKPEDIKDSLIPFLFNTESLPFFEGVMPSILSYEGFIDEINSTESDSQEFVKGVSDLKTITDFFVEISTLISKNYAKAIPNVSRTLYGLLLDFAALPVGEAGEVQHQGIQIQQDMWDYKSLLSNFKDGWNDMSISKKVLLVLDKAIQGEGQEDISEEDPNEEYYKKIFYIMTIVRAFVTQISSGKGRKNIGNISRLEPHPRKYLDAIIVTIVKGGDVDDVPVRLFEMMYLPSQDGGENPNDNNMNKSFSMSASVNSMSEYYVSVGLKLTSINNNVKPGKSPSQNKGM